MEQEIKVIARATVKRGRDSFSIVELKIPGQRSRKVVSAKELREKAGVRMVTQTKKVSTYLNSDEGRAWVNETPDRTQDFMNF